MKLLARVYPWLVKLPLLGLLLLLACGGGGGGGYGGGGDPAPTVTVSVTPATATVVQGQTQTFLAVLSGTSVQTVSWSVIESGGGSITNAGLYTAPLAPGTFHVQATSTAYPTAKGSATVTVPSVPAPPAPTLPQADAWDGRITLRWDAVAGATGYTLYYASATGLTPSNTLSLPDGTKIVGLSSPFTISGLTNGKRYYFILTATGSGGESAPSPEGNARPLASGLLSNASQFVGPYPAPASITFLDWAGRSRTVTAYPGQVLAYFDPTTLQAAAESAITSSGGSLLSRLPSAGIYLAGCLPGSEGALITSLKAKPGVRRALPNSALSSEQDGVVINTAFVTDPIPVPLNITGPTAIDSGAHGLQVVQSAAANGATITHIVDVKDIQADGRFSADKVAFALTAIIQGNAIFNPGTPTFVNLSNGAGARQNGNWVDVALLPDPAARQQALDNWEMAMIAKLQGISALPPELRNSLVVSQSGGNCNMDVSTALADLQSIPEFAALLRNTVTVFGTGRTTTPSATYPTGVFSNRAPGNFDFVLINNPEAAQGTSFGAPAGLAWMKQIIQSTGANPAQVNLAMKQAAWANANGVVVLGEARAKAAAIVTASATDPIGSASLTSITLTAVGASNSARVAPVLAGVTVQYSVSGTDGYFDSGNLTTNGSGVISFSIPPGAPGVVDTIAVTAVLSGRGDRRAFTW